MVGARMSQFLHFGASGSGISISGTLEVDDHSSVIGISGTVNGVPIDGLSNFGGADNLVSLASSLGAFHTLYNYYRTDDFGIGFTSAGVSYLIRDPMADIHPPTTFSGQGTLTSSASPGVDVVVQVGISGTVAVPFCFARGTRISTVQGEVPVEDLQVGDVVITSEGRQRSITWIGHRRVDCTAAAVPSKVWPVRIGASAFGMGLPRRDLRLSPGHPVLVTHDGQEVLVPIMCLINGTSVARIRTDQIDYWHVELEQHDILLAEGLPAESFLDLGCRSWFEAEAADALNDPDFIVPGLDARCRPVVVEGTIVEAERKRLDAVFATALAAQSGWPSPLNPLCL